MMPDRRLEGLLLSEALQLAQKIADSAQRKVWLRGIGGGDWLISDHPCGYYQSTERLILPDPR